MITSLTISPIANLFRPFRAWVSWRCHDSEGRYRLANIYRPFRAMSPSPEGAVFVKEGCSPSAYRTSSIPSPERAAYINDGCSPSNKT